MNKLLKIMLIIGLLSAPAQAGDFPVIGIALIAPKQTHELRVELAAYAPARQYGLMNRQTVAPYDGMLFDFKAEQTITMWMKNTFIPLDMVFYNARQEVVHIHYDATPESLELIRSPVPARYVLEVPAGDAARYGIKPGHRFEIRQQPAGDQAS